MSQVIWGDICRLCAEKPINNNGDNTDNNIIHCNNTGNLTRYCSYIDAILNYLGVKITDEDAFPKHICRVCVRKIEEFDSYTDKCLNVQKYFEKISGTYSEISVDKCIIKSELEVDVNSSLDGCDIKHENEILIKQEVDDDYSNSFFDNSFEDDEFTVPLITFQKASKKKTKKKKLKIKVKIKEPIRSDDLNRSVSGNEIDDSFQPEYFSCDQCPRVTKTEKALERHKLRHIPKLEKNFSCTSCGKTFSSKENLKSHERVHIPLYERYNYECGICGNKFTTKSAVVGHTRAVHEKIKRYICDVCGYACSTGGELIQHRAIHSEEKQFECNRCGKRFKTGSNLKAHLDTHDSTSYSCSMCDKILNSRRTLRKHMLVHEDVCRHVCSFCNKAFKRRQTLKVHLTSHTGDTPIQCPWCPQKFAYSSACRTHKQRFHSEQMNGEIHVPQITNTFSAIIPTSDVTTTVQGLSVQGLLVQDIPVETISLQNMAAYEIEIPTKLESTE